MPTPLARSMPIVIFQNDRSSENFFASPTPPLSIYKFFWKGGLKIFGEIFIIPIQNI